jgi:flavin reductase (DIM6/NTAB) family NADH-FMN oxidoreductase RutF
MRRYLSTVPGTLLLLTVSLVLAAVSSASLTPALNAATTSKAEGEAMESLGASTLILPVPVWIIGSYDSDGKPNAMTASWVGICNSDPPCVTISLKEIRYSYGNIMERKAFTVNIPSERYAAESAFFGTVSGRDVDKFAATGLTAVKSALVDAPYIGEFPLVAECKLIHTYKVGSHVMMIGEILDVKAHPSVLKSNGRPGIKMMKPFVYTPGSGTFVGLGEEIGSVRELQRRIAR